MPQVCQCEEEAEAVLAVMKMWWLPFLELVSEHKVQSGKTQGASVLWEGNVRKI